MPHTVRKHRPSGSSFGVYFRLFLSLALIVGFCWVIFSDAMPGQILPPTQGSTQPSTAPATYRDDTFYEVRGVWVASASNLDFPSAKGLSAEDLKAELDQIVATVKAAGLNTIFFQVRPHADALYTSAVYPWSSWVSGIQGQAPDGGFDPLAYIIEKAHAEGLQLHAWVNPFRILSGTEKAPADTSVLAENSPAVLHPEWTVSYAGSLVFDPGIPQVRQMVISGVQEIAQRYDVDGIHFDDYFYPYRVTLADGSEAVFDDADTFASYGKEGQTLDEFRLESINLLVRDAAEAIHEARPGCEFGISPFGVWRTTENSSLGFDADGVLESYTDHYADSYTWVKEGWVDYIAPQLYWSMDASKTPFDEIYRWWAGVTADTDVKLLAGHAYYKVGTGETGWSDPGELIQQVRYIRANSQYGGSIFYRYADLKANTQGVTDALKQIYAQDFSLELPKGTGLLNIEFPSEYYATASPSLCITGVADNGTPLYCNGVSLSTTRQGRFAHFVELEEGENRFVFTQGELVRTIVIQRKSATSYTLMDKEEMRVLWPASDFIDAPETEVTLRVTAPAGSTVTARLGSQTVTLKQTDNTPATVDGKPCRAEFSGVLTLPKMNGKDATVSLGKVSFEATTPSGANLAVTSGGEVMLLLPQTYSYAVVINEGAVIYEAPDERGTAYTAAPEGMTDYIYAQDRGYYRFRYGGWIKMTDVEFHRDAKLWINYMESVKAKVNGDFVEIRFDMKENVPASGRCEDGDFVLTVYNTKKANLLKVPAVNNALYSSVSYESLSDNVAEYTFDLKGAFYGFELSYEEGEILLVRLRLPKIATDGAQPLQGFKILLDAGHGGDDPGAEGIGASSGLSEAELNLAVTLALRTKLEKLGATVTLTRNDDSTVLLAERVKLFDSVKPDLCLSIHHNAVAETLDAGTVRGISGHYTYDAGRWLAEKLASSVAKELMLEKRADYRMQLAITNRHDLPAALLELGFVTSPEEYESMLETDYASRMAAAIAKALVEALS